MAWPEQIEAATTVLSPSPHTNLLAIEAPADGEGNYSAEEIRYVLSTAYAGFSAICDESIATLKSGSVSLNTGFWGCGAYGGNRVLMVLLQMIAAQLAGIDRLVFFLGGSDGQESFDMALEIHSDLSRSGDLRVDDLINLMEQLNFSWGYIDGN